MPKQKTLKQAFVKHALAALNACGICSVRYPPSRLKMHPCFG